MGGAPLHEAERDGSEGGDTGEGSPRGALTNN